MKPGAVDSADPSLLWVHGGAGYLDIATEILLAFKTDGLVGSNSDGPSCQLQPQKRTRMTLRAISTAALYNCFRAMAYVQPFVDPVGGASSLAFTMSEFIPTTEEANTPRRTTAKEMDQQTDDLDNDPITPDRGGGDGPMSGDAGSDNVVKAGRGYKSEVKSPHGAKPFVVPSMGTLMGNRADGRLLADFQLWSHPKVRDLRGSGFLSLFSHHTRMHGPTTLESAGAMFFNKES
jgi:hypothetical protein